MATAEKTGLQRWLWEQRSSTRLAYALQITTRLLNSAVSLLWIRLLFHAMGGPLNGLYLTLMKAGRTQEAMEVFGRLIDAGFRRQRLGVIFLFEARTAEFIRDPGVAAVYPAWLERIGDRTRAAGVCLRIGAAGSRLCVQPILDVGV